MSRLFPVSGAVPSHPAAAPVSGVVRGSTRVIRPPVGANLGVRSDAAVTRRTRIGSEQDIVAAVLAARDGHHSIRAVGSRGSKNDCFLTSGSTLQLDRYDKVLAVQGDLVVAQAGITIGKLNETLRRHGLALPTVGEWAGATLGGAVATGTHGGSGTHGILASSVRALRLITGKGQALDLDRGSELFDHAAVSLGMLGVTSTLTLRCVEHFHLALEIGVVPLDQYLGSHATENRANEFYSAVWVPAARRVITFSGNRTPGLRGRRRRMTRFGPRTFLLSALSQRVALPESLGRWLPGTAVDEVGPMLSPISYGPGRLRLLRSLGRQWKAVEFAVPLSRAGESITLFDRFMEDHRGAFTHPIGFRATPRDTFSLSPCYGRDTFWFDIFFRDNERLERELGHLFEALDARCHWGKHIGLSPAHLQGQYPRWDGFAAARTRLDPDDIFANSFTRRFGL